MDEATYSKYGRRRLLGVIGTGTAVGIAGCLGDGTDGDDDPEAEGADVDPESDDGDDEETGDGGDADTDDPGGEDETDLGEAVAFPDQECTVCSMIVEEHPDWNAQLVHEGGHREFFCSTGCLTAYYGAPEVFDGPDEDVANVWVTGYETGELIDASEAVFVRVTDPDHVDDVMMRNPTPFADRGDAESFVGGFDEYDEDDILEFAEFDRELGEYYRGRFFEDSDDGEHDDHDD